MDQKQQDNIRTLLTDAIIKVCQTEAVYTSELRIEGTVCVVSDHASVMIAHFSECVGSNHSLDNEYNNNWKSGSECLVDALSIMGQTELTLPEVKIEHVPNNIITFEDISDDGDNSSVMHGICEAAEKSMHANNNNEADDVKQSACGRHQCPDCQKMFKLKRTLQSHLRMHHGHQPHTCHHCTATFPLRATLRTHIAKEHGRLYKRHNSGEKLASRSVMQHHAYSYSDVPETFESVAVDDVCVTGDETTPGCLEADGADSIRLLEALEQKDWEKMMENTQLLMKSMNTANDQTLLQPPECHEYTVPEPHCSSSEQHGNVKATVMQYFEKVNVETSHGLYKFKCCLCHKMFKLRTSLYEHINSHTGKRRYACDTCGDRFVHHSSLHNHINNKHMLKRQDTLRYLCNGCDRRFKFRSEYERHLKSFPSHCIKTLDVQ